MERSKRITVFSQTEGMTSQSFSQLESTVFAPSSLTKAASNSHAAMLDMEQSIRMTFSLLLVAKVILSNLALSNSQISTIDDLSLATIVIIQLKCISCTGPNQLWYQDVLSRLTLNLIDDVYVLGYYFYSNLALYNGHLYLLANAIQLAPVLINQLYMQIAEIFKSVVSLFFLAACIDKNYDQFILSLLFKRVVFLYSHGNGSRNNSESNKSSSRSESEVESSVKEGCVYEKDKELS